jgi:hypothetical protein
MASSVKALELANTHESDPKRRREWEISTRKELRRLAAIEQERTALLVNEQNLREELVAQVEQAAQPVAWMVYWGVGDMKPAFPPHRDKAFAEYMASQIKSVTEVRALYTSPPKAAPLTEFQIHKVWSSENGLEDCDMCKLTDFTTVVRFVEQLHGITPATVEKEGE